MPQIVDIPGVGEVEFPDSMTDEQITEAIRTKILPSVQEPQAEQRGFVDELGRQLGLTVRAVAQNIAAIPAMVAQPLADVADMGLEAAGSDFRFGNQAAGLSNLLTQAGLPEPENATERVVQDAAGALTAGGAVTKVAQNMSGPIARRIAESPGIQAAADIVGSTLAGGAREAGLPGPVQAAVGIGGALAVPAAAGTAPAIRRGMAEGVDVLRQLRGERTPGMVEEYAGTRLSRDAQRRLRSAERLGQQITPAEALGDPILAARQGALGTSDEGARSLVDFGARRIADQEGAVSSLLDSVSTSGKSAAADVRATAQRVLKRQQDALSAQAAPIYKKAFESAIDNDTARQLLSDPLLARTAEAVRTSALYRTEIGDIAKKSDKLSFRSGVASKQVGVSSGLRGVRFWDLVKRQLDDEIEKAMRAGERNQARLLQSSRDKVVESLDAVSPEYAAARAIYGEGARPLQALREGAVGRIASLPDDKLKTVSRILFDPNETNPRVLGQLRQQFMKEDPDAWRGIIRNEMERRLDTLKADRTGTSFYNAILAKDRDFHMFLNATRGMPDVQRALIDMRRVWKDLINPETVKGAAGKATSSLDVPRSSVEAIGNLLKNFLGGQADQAAVNFITDPRWADDLARVASIKDRAAREKALLMALEGVNRAAGATAVTATMASEP